MSKRRQKRQARRQQHAPVKRADFLSYPAQRAIAQEQLGLAPRDPRDIRDDDPHYTYDLVPDRR